jgi:hypothetical protein
MPWAGPYYYRSVRVNGQPRREYVGSGRFGELAAQLDVLERQDRELKEAAERKARADAAALDELVSGFNAAADDLAHAALLAAGCRQHNRGEWRKSRGRHQAADQADRE